MVVFVHLLLLFFLYICRCENETWQQNIDQVIHGVYGSYFSWWHKIQFYFEDDNSARLTKYQLLSSLSDNVVRCYDAIFMIYDDYLMYLQNIYIFRCYYSFLTIWLRKKIQFGVCVKSIYKKKISGHNWQIIIMFDC